MTAALITMPVFCFIAVNWLFAVVQGSRR